MKIKLKYEKKDLPSLVPLSEGEKPFMDLTMIAYVQLEEGSKERIFTMKTMLHPSHRPDEEYLKEDMYMKLMRTLYKKHKKHLNIIHFSCLAEEPERVQENQRDTN